MKLLFHIYKHLNKFISTHQALSRCNLLLVLDLIMQLTEIILSKDMTCNVLLSVIYFSLSSIFGYGQLPKFKYSHTVHH